ncbi:integrase catalytic domain-containing protein [Trichonephila clavipes]|nr:integrase catalytic domain-containing protein [Trichonephila clavipes]
MWINEDTGTHSEVSCDNGRDESEHVLTVGGQTQEIDQLQRKIEELKELLFGLETAKPTEEEFEEDLYKCETRLDDLETKTNLLMNRSVENKSCIVCKDKTLHPIFRCKRFLELNPEKRLDLVRLHKLCELCLRKNHKRMQCTSTETEFGWIAGGRLQGTNTNNFSCYFLKDNDSVDDTLKLFFELESLGIKDDPCYRKDDQAMNIFKETVQYNNNRYVVELPFRKHWNELSNNISVAKQRFQSLWGRLRRDKTLYTQYKETIQDYLNQGIIEKGDIGVNSSPFLLAATIKYHIEKYNEIHPITVQHLDSFMYVDDWITGQDTREEALFMSRHAKNIMKEAGMEMRKWISNDTVLMAQWAAEGFDTHPMDASIRLGTNKTKVLGMAWQTLDDCLTLDTKGLLEFVSINENNIRFMLQTIGKIFDPLGLLSPFTIRIKCLIQELWIKKITWDEILPPKLKEKWLIWCKELPLLDNLRIPRLVLDSTNDEVSDLIEIHIFCDASKLAYGAAAYVKVRKQNEVLVNLITSKTRVAPLKAVTLPRLELLGALVAARLSSRVQEIVRKKRSAKCSTGQTPK